MKLRKIKKTFFSNNPINKLNNNNNNNKETPFNVQSHVVTKCINSRRSGSTLWAEKLGKHSSRIVYSLHLNLIIPNANTLVNHRNVWVMLFYFFAGSTLWTSFVLMRDQKHLVLLSESLFLTGVLITTGCENMAGYDTGQIMTQDDHIYSFLTQDHLMMSYSSWGVCRRFTVIRLWRKHDWWLKPLLTLYSENNLFTQLVIRGRTGISFFSHCPDENIWLTC